MGMTINESERYLRLMLGGMKYAVRYWKDRDKEESDIEQTNVEAVETALETMCKYQKIEDIYYHQSGQALENSLRAVIEDGKIDNLCKSCINLGCEFQSGIVRTECAFYMPPHIEAIPKADYEARLKADLKAILVELQLKIEEFRLDFDGTGEESIQGFADGLAKGNSFIQQKINSLKED